MDNLLPMRTILLSARLMMIIALVPSVSHAEPSKPGMLPQVHEESERYVSSSADWDKLRQALEGDADNTFVRARHLEGRQLANGAHGVRREGNSLFLKIHGGQELELHDEGAGDSTMSYSYYDIVPALDAYVLHVQYYEGDAWLLVSRKTGARTKLSGLPVVCPDKRRFVTGSYDLDAGYNPNEVVVWAIGGDGSFKEEWKTEPKEWGPTFLEWLSPTRFRVRCEKPHWDSDKPAPKPMSRRYGRVAMKWQQVGDAEPWRD